MLDIAGGADAVGDIKRESVQMSTEMILARAPDVIIELHYGASLTPERMEAERHVWDTLGSIPAVRNGRVYLVVGDEYVVPGPAHRRGNRTSRAAAASGRVQMKTLVSWSSGKDSAWMVHVLRQRGDVEIGALLTTINEPAQRVAMHAVRVELLEAQADALGLPLWKMPIPSPCPNEIYERAMADAVARAVAEGFTHMAFADLFLEDIRRYREERLAGTGLTPIFPLFGADTAALAREMIAGGLGARTDLHRSARPRSRGSPAASSTRRCSPTCRRRSTRAASAASSTPSPTAARCSASIRFRSKRASPSSAMGSCSPTWS